MLTPPQCQRTTTQREDKALELTAVARHEAALAELHTGHSYELERAKAEHELAVAAHADEILRVEMELETRASEAIQLKVSVNPNRDI